MTTSHSGFAYQPALDGVRALAVAAVLLFHAETPGFSGGYLGVSIFFTLSGYLITSLLVTEFNRSGDIGLGAFYGRRIRRLMPASIAVIVAVTAIASLTDEFDAVRQLRAQVIGSLFQVVNWVLLAGDDSYQDLFARTQGTASPLEHFWSLAIEEQFYWVWPPVLALLLRRCGSNRRLVISVLAITVAFMAMAPIIAVVWGADAAYWATPARLGEILAGAGLAVLLTGPVDARWRHAVLPSLGLLGLAVVTFPASGGPAYAGALPVVATVSAVLLAGLQVDSRARRVISAVPLRAIGRVSYGLYVYHFPIYLVVDADRLGVDGATLTVARLALTGVVATLSFHLLEVPIRQARLPWRPTLGYATAATASVALLALGALPPPSPGYWDLGPDEIAAAAIELDDESFEPLAWTDGGDGIGASAQTATSRPARILVTGDSTAGALGAGLVLWAGQHPDLAQVEIVAIPGCGLLRGGERKVGNNIESTSGCSGWVENLLLPAVERTKPDVVVIMVTTWDLLDRRWEDGEMLSPIDSPYRSRLRADYARTIEQILAAGASSVALIDHPIPDVYWKPATGPQENPARHAVLADIRRDVAEGFGDEHVVTIELDRWLEDRGFGDDRAARPDGVHLARPTATRAAEDLLGRELLSVAIESHAGAE